MTHTSKEKSKLLSRLRRIRGQIDAVERALQEDRSCAAVLQQATACRGALEGFVAEIIEDHIREHLFDAGRPETARGKAAEELIEIVHSYLT
jgi:DNA-binding FrmR family transcriptional regulator